MIGKLMLALGVLWAHSEILHEHRIDGRVLKSFRVERVLTIIGIILILLGYGMETYFYGFTTDLLTCWSEDCAAAAAVILAN